MSEGDRQVEHQVILTSWLIKVAEGSTVCILGVIINRSLELRREVFNTGCFLIFLVLEPPEEIKKMFLPPSSYHLDSGLIIWVRLRPSPFQRFLSLTAIGLTMGCLISKAWFQTQPAKASIFSLPNRDNVGIYL